MFPFMNFFPEILEMQKLDLWVVGFADKKLQNQNSIRNSDNIYEMTKSWV